MSELQPVLQCSGITKSFKSEENERERLEILKGVDLTVGKKEIATIVGSSGSGKSTLLHILGGLDSPDSGEVWWNGREIHSLTADELADDRNANVGFVFQFHHLLPEFTALENVMMPAFIAGTSEKKATVRASELLDRFGLGSRLHHRPSQLSGGEQQRVSVARALMNHPPMILADEPTGNLDESNTHSILSLLFELRDTENLSLLIITHDIAIARQTDAVYSLQSGSLHAVENA
ncbi:MAG: ABC transporter ATP-binding protein [Balneolaceae bacterium]